VETLNEKWTERCEKRGIRAARACMDEVLGEDG